MQKMRSKKSNLGKILKSYEEKWVALSPDKRRVISSGDTLKEVESKIDSKDIEHVIFMKVPPSGMVFIAFAHEI
ncbi:MAG: hypothetical protein A3J54_02630 [Candidatus Ryanbacteria bacterium RIFCSPHIGHO2_02_FULL_45_13b]|uniref:DUF5678 domain-containing protein n=1 Tax=Candidatus Ryanbacteria bacterium RIFCSPHIGHO2_02_FULL_45_13b TaxID=1802117 RepID=A0A1G2G7P7_9BACT|nr:MAG: hypothetical protein A3J54_02630 [Candidatus Ryanbacteria bacterium RIFCSPHIGHO2_02_FULL_45_13b]